MKKKEKISNKEKTSFGGLKRSMLMSKIRSKENVTTELKMINLLREYHLKGWRRNIPLEGKPDFVWRKERVALFVDGCFWHGHNCGRNLTPKTNAIFWLNKINKNKKRDKHVNHALREKGWIILRIWECELKKKSLACMSRIEKALKRTK